LLREAGLIVQLLCQHRNPGKTCLCWHLLQGGMPNLATDRPAADIFVGAT
jgi:hypothetical protein